VHHLVFEVRDAGRLDCPDLFELDSVEHDILTVRGLLRLLQRPLIPCLSCASRQAASGTIQSWSRSPPSPSGFSSLWFGPATYPSADIEM
jgi:hypothetical protein